MKKKTLIIIIFISIILSACTKKDFIEFEFDNFYGYFFTENNFAIDDTKAEGLGYSIIKGDIMKVYKKTTGSGYKDNIIIIKKQTDSSVKEFAEIMGANIKTEGYKADNMKSMQITCKDEKVPGYYINAKVVGNLSTTYLHFSFLKQNENLYIVSIATQDESEKNTFASDMKGIKCRK